MNVFKKAVSLILIMALVLFTGACSNKNENANTGSLDIDNSAWNYDSTNNVYWQIGVSYCTKPQAQEYETMGIFVPGQYMNATDNGDGTYTCTVNTEGSISGYTADTAPIVMPVNTAGYSAQAAPTSYNYNEMSSYLQAGYIYVYAGCRGRNNGTNEDGSTYDGGAPWGVTDLKAAIRYLRYNTDVLAGNTDRIFTFGHSGGGAQSAIVGASGDSELYYDYLNTIGAAMTDKNGNPISDSICGVMSWCPITNLDSADSAYEWMMGQYSSTGTRSDDTWTSALSDDLAEQYALYINSLGLKDESGNTLTLTESNNGIYASGSYYNYMLSVIETSLNNFLADTQFPYTSGSDKQTGGGQRPDKTDGELPNGTPPDLNDGEKPANIPSNINNGEQPTGTPPDISNVPNENIASNTSENQQTTTYQTAQDYIASLNGDSPWITYNADSNTVSITSIEAFVIRCKTATKDVCAFDDLNRSQAENMVFGNGDNDALHFNQVITKLLNENSSVYSAFSDYNSSYAQEYSADMSNTDALGTDTSTRQNMYNPMYYILNADSSNIAKYWRINSGITQGDTSLTTEMNLALALKNNESTEKVDFTTVWAQGHTNAERSGNGKSNFIAWINSCFNIE